jgi:NAD(P)H-hydrate epimerase
MTGAAALCAFGAFRVGAGLVISAAPQSINDIYEKKITEAMTLICDDDNKGCFLLKNYEDISKKFDWADVVIIGPGVGQDIQTFNLVEKIIRNCTKPIVIDADGLKVFDKNRQLFNKIKVPFVITPHYGEMSRILDVDSQFIKNKFTSIIDEFMDDFKGVLIAKNAPSCTLFRNDVYINSSGNPGLSTAGTGDILAGMIGGLIAQGISIKDASRLAVYIHGKAADNYVKNNGMRGMIASDILNEIPSLLSKYEN